MHLTCRLKDVVPNYSIISCGCCTCPREDEASPDISIPSEARCKWRRPSTHVCLGVSLHLPFVVVLHLPFTVQRGRKCDSDRDLEVLSRAYLLCWCCQVRKWTIADYRTLLPVGEKKWCSCIGRNGKLAVSYAFGNSLVVHSGVLTASKMVKVNGCCGVWHPGDLNILL